MIVLIDNYDSFTYNLYQYIRELGQRCRVYRNDKVSIESIRRKKPKAIVLSPGPGAPKGAGICLQLIHALKDSIPILGVCLGHQAIGEAFGAKIGRAKTLMHGKTSEIFHQADGVFQGVESPFQATRYHSLVVEKESIPSTLEITAQTGDGVVMGIRSTTGNIEGVQFHPESMQTKYGKKILANFFGLGGD